MGRLAAAILVAFVAGVVLSHTHSHEPAHMKYTREVNEAAADEDHGHAHEHHGHAHGPGGCPHAHSHEAHGHAHEEAHGHAHDHAHSHGGHGHSHDSHTAKKRDVHVEEVKYEGVMNMNINWSEHWDTLCHVLDSLLRMTEENWDRFLSFMNDAKTRLWVHAIGATLLISAAPCFILMFIPIQDATSAESGPLLKVLLSFGSGGLLGDAFLHLIPHATPAGDGHAHSHSHSHSEGGHSHAPHDMSVGGWVLAGIIAFLVVEKVVRIIRGEDGHGHSHGHSHGGKKEKCSDDESDEKKKGGDKKKKGEKKEDAPREIKVAAYLNLVADFAHNFTDGLAIGASFIAGTTVGVVTMVTVLVHEVPHEIGDFAILIQSGYSKKKAMLVQLVTALGALSGCVLSLWAADTSLADAAASSWVLPFTAGGFIYIATVSVMPELLENSSSWQSIKEMIALGLGIFMMYLIAIFE